MKRLSCFMLALILTLGLAACGGNGGGGDSGSPAAKVLSAGETVPMEELTPKSSGKKLGWQTEAPEEGEEIAVVTMQSGQVFKIRFFPNEAPKAVYNFKKHAMDGYFDGMAMHRVIANFMIQGGSPDGTGTDGESVWGKDFEDEFDKSLVNIDGALSMANAGPATNGSQFFINCTGTPASSEMWSYYESQYEQFMELYKENKEAFDANPNAKTLDTSKITDEYKKLYEQYGGNMHLDGAYSTNSTGHTVFGQVFEGMDGVYELSKVKTDENDKPIEDMVIESVKIEKYDGGAPGEVQSKAGD